jgi:hypothetical protein
MKRIICSIVTTALVAFGGVPSAEAADVPLSSSAVTVSSVSFTHAQHDPRYYLMGLSAKTASGVYVVQKGQNLSQIAEIEYGNAAAWPVIYYANNIKWANEITPGEILSIPPLPRQIPAQPANLQPYVAPVAYVKTQPLPRSVKVTEPVEQATPLATTYSGTSGFQQCVISRESGGNPQVMNSSGHYGLYQFSASTWAAYGGNPADFGDASVSEQNQVFDNAMSHPGGEDNWAPYDGC